MMRNFNDLNIGYEGSDEAVSSLIMRFEDGDLLIDVDCQRGDVWDTKRSSKLIESVCLGLPLPIIYIFENKEQSELIDGKQRFLSLFKFINGEYKLTGLKALRHLNGKRFKDLTREEQKTIKNHKLHVFSLKADSEEAKYEIFERLNTGGTVLKSQEIILGINEGSVTEFATKVTNSLIADNVESINSNKHKQVDAKVISLMYFMDGVPSNNVVRTHESLLLEVLTKDKFKEKLNDSFVDDAALLMQLTKQSALNVSRLIWKERTKPTLNTSMREVFMCLMYKHLDQIKNIQPINWRKTIEPLEEEFAYQLNDREDMMFAFTYSTKNKPARMLKTQLINELTPKMDKIIMQASGGF